MIHLELCKKFEIDQTKKWYMHNSETVGENETHKVLWDFEMRTDHRISARWPGLVIVNKKRTCPIVDFAVPTDHRVKLKEIEKRNKYWDLAREQKIYRTWSWRRYQLSLVQSKQILKGLEDLEIREQMEIISATNFLRSARMLRRVRET